MNFLPKRLLNLKSPQLKLPDPHKNPNFRSTDPQTVILDGFEDYSRKSVKKESSRSICFGMTPPRFHHAAEVMIHDHPPIPVKTWAGLLNTFCTNGKLELELINKVQIQCYEDAKLMKLFPEIIKSLYDQDVLAEDTILHWYRKGTNPKGRQTFVKAIEPFVNCLEEAEEE